MKHLIQLTIALLLLIHSIGFSQTKSTDIITKKSDTISKKKSIKAVISNAPFKSFIGKYYLEEADIMLEIIEENDAMYILSPGSKDPMIKKNETTLCEPKRGVYLERVEGDENTLKFSQNGYNTTIKKTTTKE